MDCYNCGELGHIKRDCPIPLCGGYVCHDSGYGGGAAAAADTRVCYNCGEVGHISRDCPIPHNPGYDDGSFGGVAATAADSRTCYNCGEVGHISRDCPNDNGYGGEGAAACFNCGELGHIRRDCPEFDLHGPADLMMLAASRGWHARRTKGSADGHNAHNKTLFLVNEGGTRIDLFYGTMTVKTTVDHPVRGMNQMFRPPEYSGRASLLAILDDPRVHSGVGCAPACGHVVCQCPVVPPP